MLSNVVLLCNRKYNGNKDVVSFRTKFSFLLKLIAQQINKLYNYVNSLVLHDDTSVKMKKYDTEYVCNLPLPDI